LATAPPADETASFNGSTARLITLFGAAFDGAAFFGAAFFGAAFFGAAFFGAAFFGAAFLVADFLAAVLVEDYLPAFLGAAFFGADLFATRAVERLADFLGAFLAAFFGLRFAAFLVFLDDFFDLVDFLEEDVFFEDFREAMRFSPSQNVSDGNPWQLRCTTQSRSTCCECHA